MGDDTYVFVDIETNGGSGERGRVIEVAAIKVVNGGITDTYQTLLNPGGDIPYWITKLTGITRSDVKNAPYFSDIAEELHTFLQGSIFVAHNVMFDYSFLKREFAALGLSFSPKLYCTVKMSRALYPEHRGHSLEKIIARHGIVTSQRHRAYDDARAMYDYVQTAIRDKGSEAFLENIALQLKTRSLPPNVDERIIFGLPTTPGVYIFKDDAGLPLYVGKSINIRSRVRSHFANATTIAKELKMTLRSYNIDYIQTDTELEALLLESAKIKELQPLFNRRLRRKTSQHLIIKHIDAHGYLTFTIESHDLGRYQELDRVYGVFSSKASAKTSLETLTRTFSLCPKLVGLESSKGACFRSQLGSCNGACTGKEPPTRYNDRVELALQTLKIESWPFASKISIAISSLRSLIVDQWVPQSIYDSQSDTYTELANMFDMDTYKILRSYIRTHAPVITRL